MAKENLGNGFFHYGVATPISNHRGTVATVDGEGRNIVLVWLYDHRGSYALLLIDAETGKSEEFSTPFEFDPGFNTAPFASILSSRNKYYTHFNSQFMEFDPEARAFTFHHETEPDMAMSMTEDDEGQIWSATYPDSGVVSFNPETREFRDYGLLYDQNWRQYPRAIAADDTGWIYFGIGSTASQIIILDPETGNTEPVLQEEEREKAHAPVYRDLNGKVYGNPGSNADEGWIEFYRGKWAPIGTRNQIQKKPIIADSQALFHRDFPDGKRVATCDLVDRKLTVEIPKTEAVQEVAFEYTSEGAHIMGLAVAPDNTICGGTAFPMRFFSYNPDTDAWTNRAAYGQWNTVARGGNRFFVGAYTHGVLQEWDPSQPWVPTEKDNPDANPRFLFECHQTLNRPHMLLAHPDGKTVVLAGTPGYGYTGGGLLFWDRETESQTLLEHTDILPEHSTMSLVALPDNKLLGGTTTSAGTGGEQKATEAELYLMDIFTKEIIWHQVLFPGIQAYIDMCPGPNGLVYGIADRKHFFVFNPDQKKTVYERALESDFGPTNSQQGPRVFVIDGDTVYILFVKGIARIDPATFTIEMLAESPVPIGPGGDMLNGHIYFGSGSHLYSYQVLDF